MRNNVASSKPSPARLSLSKRRRRQEEDIDKQEISEIMFHRFRSPSFYSEREAALIGSMGVATIRHLHPLGLIERMEGRGGSKCSIRLCNGIPGRLECDQLE